MGSGSINCARRESFGETLAGSGTLAYEEIFCLAARAGLPNIKVVIVPTDWRTKPFKPTTIPGPSWLPELYAMLKEELERLK